MGWNTYSGTQKIKYFDSLGPGTYHELSFYDFCYGTGDANGRFYEKTAYLNWN